MEKTSVLNQKVTGKNRLFKFLLSKFLKSFKISRLGLKRLNHLHYEAFPSFKISRLGLKRFNHLHYEAFPSFKVSRLRLKRLNNLQYKAFPSFKISRLGLKRFNHLQKERNDEKSLEGIKNLNFRFFFTIPKSFF